VQGPKARALLQSITNADLTNEAFPFGHSREIELGYAIVRASRITYMGELGWELYMPTEFATGVYDAIIGAGNEYGLKHVGMHAMNSLRIEKGYRHWGHDITDEENPIQAGLGFAIAWDKKGGFIGRDALLNIKQSCVTQRIVQFLLTDPEKLLYHNEPIYRGGIIVGYLTSGMYGHTLGGSVGLGYVVNADGVDAQFINEGKFEIEVAGIRVPATASLRPMYDPTSERVRI
jgi:glycine cleavage system aminomethyltransferase T